jgi:hypothetical protein
MIGPVDQRATQIVGPGSASIRQLAAESIGVSVSGSLARNCPTALKFSSANPSGSMTP